MTSWGDHVPELNGFILILLQTFRIVSIALLKAERWSPVDREERRAPSRHPPRTPVR